MKKSFPARVIVLLLFLAGCSGISGQVTQPTEVPTIALAVEPSGLPATAAPTPTIEPENAPVWVANPVDRVVLRIDPQTNTIAARIPVEGSPEITSAGESAVWVLDREHDLVFRIDPQTNQVVTSIPLPSGEAEALTTGAGSVWVGMIGRIDLTGQVPGQEEEVAPPGIVVQIDSRSNNILKQLPVQPVSQLAVDGTALWVLSRGTIDTPLQVYDLKTSQGMAVPLHNGPEWLPAEAIAVGQDNLWLFSASYARIFHANPEGYILSAVQYKVNKPTGYASLLLSASGLWAATPWGTLLHIEPATNHLLGEIDLGIPLTGLYSSRGAVWALSQQTGTIYRIDSEKNEVTAQIATGSAVQPTVVPTATPRVIIWRPCPDAATSRLKVGDIAYVTKDPPLPNRIRKEPNREAEILGLINPGGSMDVIDGPACSDGWVWWKVKNAEYEGWTAEGDPETYWLIPLYQ